MVSMTPPPKLKDAYFLIKLLEKHQHEARLVGGCVRDRLLGIEPQDYDLAASATPDEILEIFRAARIKTLLHGKKHGTITALMPSGPIEVTTLREDVKTFGRHAEVAFQKDFEADARRRDFTINAMSEDRAGTLFDYFGGKQDLKERRLVFVGDPRKRIEEDYLRILRFFRFKARFGLSSDTVALSAIESLKDNLSKISKERITREMTEILSCSFIESTLPDMLKTGVLVFIFPELAKLNPSQIQEALDFVYHLEIVPPPFRATARIAAFVLCADPRQGHWPPTLMPSNKDLSLHHALLTATLTLAKVGPSVADHLLFVNYQESKLPGTYLLVTVPFLKVYFRADLFLQAKNEQVARSERDFGWRRNAFPLDGRDLIKELGIQGGPALGKMLEDLRFSFLNGEWQSKSEGLTKIKSKK
ncbi:MAG: CCA tRNA nucleotidyltransferase [Deltaproteobacteria bacterium]|nr:CCA tRNA nucleotidyltransferase [Deltaproteobacteria bacterium]